ncbi:MAG TPA: hypothetical protein VGQ93_10575, partial [Lysobacter sp.]|nr:hypothetical protein [Lysobacter sp.]
MPIANGIELPQGCGVVDGIACDVGGVETFDRVRVRVGPRAPGLRRRAELDADGSLPFSGT